MSRHQRTTFNFAALGLVVVVLAVFFSAFVPSSSSAPAPAPQQAWRTFPQHATETWLQVPFQGFSDAVPVRKFGRNPDIDSAATETVWAAGGLYVWPTAAETVDLVSDSAADDGSPAGTGCHAVRVVGLDASWELQEEDVTLDGLTPVTSTSSFLRVFRGYCLTVGSSLSNVGTLTASQTTSALTLFAIQPDKGQTTLGVYTVPEGHVLLIARIYGSIGRQASGAATLEYRGRLQGEAWRTGIYAGLHSQGSTWTSVDYALPFRVDARTDIELRTDVSANNSDINAGFDGYLIRIQ